MKRLLPLLLLAVSTAPAAVDGTVMNGTAGKPQPGALVTLYRLGQTGMQPVKSLKSGPGGKFRFDENVEGPRLLQVVFDGVLYNQMITPGAPSSGLSLDVYNSSRQPGDAKIVQHMVLFEPVENQLQVTENVFFRNGGKLSYNDPANGTLRIFLPEGVKGEARVTVTAPGGMPVQRQAEKTAQPGVYKVDFPVKPGETRFDVSYTVPFSVPGVFAGKILGKGAPVRLVVPAGVTLSGQGLKLLGQEPQSRATIYEAAGADYKVEIQGSGALNAASGGGDEEPGPSIEQILPRIYGHVHWILGLSLAMLLAGFLLLYRRPADPAEPGASESRSPKGARR